MKLSEKIKELKKENKELIFYAIPLSIVMFYHLIKAFVTNFNGYDFRFWLFYIMLGFIIWCLIVAIKGNLKAIKYYEKQKVSNA